MPQPAAWAPPAGAVPVAVAPARAVARERLFAGGAYVLGLVAGLLVLSTFGFLDVWENGIFGNDFSLIWAGPHVFLAGGNPYDPLTWQRSISELGVQATSTQVFIYPGWVPLFLAPFGAMDLTRAAG